MKRLLFVTLLGTALAACTPQQPQPTSSASAAADPKPIQDTVPNTSSTIPAQTYYFNPARAGSSGN